MKIRSVMQKCACSLSTLGAVVGIAIATLAVNPAKAGPAQTLTFDVFIDGTTFATDFKAPGLRGAVFIVTGRIYPGGTLASNPAAAPPGSIGVWTCRGTFTGNSNEVFSIQDFFLPNWETSITTEGTEHNGFAGVLTDTRATTGGTGVYQNINGQNTEFLIGTNGTGLANLSFTFTFK